MTFRDKNTIVHKRNTCSRHQNDVNRRCSIVYIVNFKQVFTNW